MRTEGPTAESSAPGQPVADGASPAADSPTVAPQRTSARLTARVLPTVFLVLVVGFGGYWIYRHWAELTLAWQTVRFAPVVGALVLGMAGAGSAVPIWRSVLGGTGPGLSWRSSARIVLIGQLGKYLPGGVWSVIAQARMAREEGVALVRSGSASLLSLLIAIVSAISLGVVALALSGAPGVESWWWVSLFVIPLLIALHPKALSLLGRVLGAVLKRPVEVPVISLGAVLRAAGWAFGGQVLLGLQFYVLLGMVSGQWHSPLLAIGIFQVASVAGILVFFAAAGAGPRELILVAGTAGSFGPGQALLAALLSRAVLTVADFALAGLGWWLGRRAADPARSPDAPSVG